MNKKRYVRGGSDCGAVGPTNRPFLTDGIYLVETGGSSYQRVARLCTLKKTFPFAQMAKEAPELATYLRVKALEIIGSTLRMNNDGSWTYTIPSTAALASDILTFLAMDKDERQRAIQKAASETTKLDSDGNVVDDLGKRLYTKYSKEAFAVKLRQLKKQVKEYERILADKMIDDL